MMPYDTYRVYQIERAKSPGEIRRADEQAARLASAVSWLFRGIMRPARAVSRPHLAVRHDGAPRVAEPAAGRGTMAGVMEGS
jgi:hypothetical protein